MVGAWQNRLWGFSYCTHYHNWIMLIWMAPCYLEDIANGVTSAPNGIRLSVGLWVLWREQFRAYQFRNAKTYVGAPYGSFQYKYTAYGIWKGEEFLKNYIGAATVTVSSGMLAKLVIEELTPCRCFLSLS
jgi:hypothetical protein